MVKITVESFSDDDLMKKYIGLTKKEDFDDRCGFCELPTMLHRLACTRKDEANGFEHDQVNKQWKMFSERMRNIRKWLADKEEKERGQNEILRGQSEMMQKFVQANEMLVEDIKGNESRTAKIGKPAKVPIWTKQMSLERYLKALEVWMEQNKDVSDSVRFHEVIESLKINKEVNG